MTELTKEQSEKADYLLEIVCNSESAIDSKIAYDLFMSKDETLYVCSILEKLSLIDIISATERDPIYLINWTVNTCHFLKQGGFLKKYNQTENKQTTQPIENPNEKNAIISFIEKFWWQILIPLIIGILLILIEKGIINIGI